MTLDEKLKLYMEIEPDLLIYNSSVKDREIKRLKEANEKLQKREERIEKLEDESKQRDKQFEELQKEIRLLKKYDKN